MSLYHLTLLRNYQQQAMSTAVYPEQYKLAYPTLGLVEEVAELLETPYGDRDALVKEMGDVCWYAAAVARDLDLDLQDCYDDPFVMFETDVEALFIHATKIAGRVKKILRGDKDIESKKEEIGRRLGDMLRRVSALANGFDSSLEEVCQKNVEKLSDRKERGTLKGDGDTR